MVVRGDLAPGLQIAQALHAARAFADQHRALERAWFRTSNTVAILSVKNLGALEVLIDQATTREVPHAVFREPDLQDVATAVCLAPGRVAQLLCKRFPLALKT